MPWPPVKPNTPQLRDERTGVVFIKGYVGMDRSEINYAFLRIHGVNNIYELIPGNRRSVTNTLAVVAKITVKVINVIIGRLSI